MQNRVGEKVSIPDGVTASVSGLTLTLRGKNTETRTFKARGIMLSQEGNDVVITGSPANRRVYAIVRGLKAHVQNMVAAAQHGYGARMAVVFSHFPIKVEVKGNAVEIYNFTGEKKPRVAKIVGDTKVVVKGKEIMLTGTGKESVGQTCGNIETATRVRGMDRRVYQDGIFITQKPRIIGA